MCAYLRVYVNVCVLVFEERVTRRPFIRSRCDNDPRPFNDLPKAYWHGAYTVLPYGVSEIIFKHDNILVHSPRTRRTTHQAQRLFNSTTYHNKPTRPHAHKQYNIPLDFRCVFHRCFATVDFSIAVHAASWRGGGNRNRAIRTRITCNVRAHKYH